jgi:UDP-glucose:(heptosyl)LPS alpha-1,3-glucosyltransferase
MHHERYVNERLTVALVYRHFRLDGSLPRIHVELARYLASRGHDVHVYSIRETRDLSITIPCTFHDVPVPVVRTGRWSARELWSFAKNAAAQLARERFDVVHSRAPSTWIADVLDVPGIAEGEARRAGVGRVHWLASLIRHPGNAARVGIERRAVTNPRVARFHAASRLARDDLVRYYGVEPDRVSIIWPGVDLEQFTPAPSARVVRGELQLPADQILILFCGHDFRRKGLDRALQAIAGMREAAHLVVVGGRDPTPYRRLANELGVEDRVHFVGRRSDAHHFFQAADMFVLPSRTEMWGATVVEAMATGVPVVVSGSAGVAEVVDRGETGFVLGEPFRIDELSSLLDRLATAPELRTRLGAAGRVRAAEFSWTEHGRRVEAELVAVAQARRPRRA